MGCAMVRCPRSRSRYNRAERRVARWMLKMPRTRRVGRVRGEGPGKSRVERGQAHLQPETRRGRRALAEYG